MIPPRLVLVVDSEETVLSTTVGALRHAGFEVIGVTGFDDAHREINERHIDVLISRAHVGMFHALHLARVVRSVNPRACIVILTDDHDQNLERQLGAMNGMLVPSRISTGALVSLVAMLSDCGPPNPGPYGRIRTN